MRLFVGIDLPNEIKQSLLEFQSELRQLGINASWKSQENFHITLEFLGEQDLTMIPIIVEILTKVAITNKSLILNIGGLGVFPSINRPNTLWTTVSGCLYELNRLQNEIHVELAKKGFILEDRKFKPHITLASRPKLHEIDLLVVNTKKLGEFIVDKVILFESKAIRGKRIYTDLYRISLNTSSD